MFNQPLPLWICALCVIDVWWLGDEAAGGESNNIGAEAIEETGDDPEEPAEEKKKTKVL